MRSKEINDVTVTSIELLIFSVLCLMLAYFAILGRSMYEFKEEQEAAKEVIKKQGEQYFFKNGEKIHGSDIVEFIIKYDVTYNYFIMFKNGSKKEITKELAREEQKKGEKYNMIWTQEYLTNRVFGDYISKEYTVTMITNGDKSMDLYIYEK